ncbi:hypothetical protein [Pseudorhodobacter sp.]|uniref:hypothetical protein n=1 Tax=Pseudorhodobacter sp. TaxID=1934400 RepID=UPI0026481DDB|nr:hypothetical protein [Pseudorhodobacter sp.]MDN5786910.1 hypothetical protein [Pseudorhodobacter sp.]
MLTLNLAAAPVWIDLMPGVRVHLRPMCNAFLLRAQSQPGVLAAIEAEDREAHSVAQAAAVFEAAVIEWEGVGDRDGAVIPPSPAAIAALMDMYKPYSAFLEQYFHPWLVVDAEKNGSAPSLNGTSAAAQSIAVPATQSVKTARGTKTRRRA